MEWDVRYAVGGAPGAEEGPPRGVVAVGNVVFVSGCTCGRAGKLAPQRVEEQVDLALENVRRVLESVGSGMENIVKTFFLLTSLDDYGSVRRIETEFYERHAPKLVSTPPAATLMVVPSLARPELLVQYEVVAALDRDMAGWGVRYYPEYWAGKELAYPHVPKEHAKFARSQSIGNLLIVSGCQALDHETLRVEAADFAEQCRVVLDKVRIAVEEAGGSLENLVKTNVFVKDASAPAVYREIEQKFFRERAPGLASDPPASTVFVVAELPRPEFLIEVEAFAVVDANVPGWPVHRRPGSPEAAESATAGRLVFASACDGSGEGSAGASIEREIAAALDNLGDALERAGSAISRIVRLTLLLHDSDDYALLLNALDAHFAEHAPNLVETPPAMTFMQVPTTVPPGVRFQLDAIAVS
ncbi:MAG TPA: RidA family protein [Gaiellaceae bacterium]|jgi:enamine deaminase RidA (YjgF/YER057c/UK114 family)